MHFSCCDRLNLFLFAGTDGKQLPYRTQLSSNKNAYKGADVVIKKGTHAMKHAGTNNLAELGYFFPGFFNPMP